MQGPVRRYSTLRRFSASAAARFLILAGVLTAATGLTYAGSLAVTNPGFETLPAGGLNQSAGCPPGCSYSWNVAIPGWSVLGLGSFIYGQIQPGGPLPNSQYNSIPAGDPTLGFIIGTGDIYQTVSATIVAGLTYTLQVDVGNPTVSGVTSPTSNFDTIKLLAGNLPTSPVIASGFATPAQGGFATATATYVSPANDPNAGQPLTIVLESFNGVISIRADYDNVRLSNNAGVAATPEPGSVVLVGLTFGLAVLFRRRLSFRDRTRR